MKSKLFILVLFVLFQPLPFLAATDILSDIQSLKPGCWYEIPNTHLKDAAYDWSSNPVPGVFFQGIMVA